MSRTNTSNICQNCKHWKRNGDVSKGECRKNPPIVFSHLEEFSSHKIIISRFPKSYFDDWCSFWEK